MSEIGPDTPEPGSLAETMADWEASDEYERSLMPEKAAVEPEIKKKQAVPKVTFYDAVSCYKRGEWSKEDPALVKRYTMMLRRAATGRTFAGNEQKDIATGILTALGLPFESERKQKVARRHPLGENELENLAKSRRKLVDRQKVIMLDKLNSRHIDNFLAVANPGPYQKQAIDELVSSGEVVLIKEENQQLTRGAAPFDGSGRRKRHFFYLGLPIDTEGSVPAPVAIDEDLI